jgi:hypothetical protein
MKLDPQLVAWLTEHAALIGIGIVGFGALLGRVRKG